MRFRQFKCYSNFGLNTRGFVGGLARRHITACVLFVVISTLSFQILSPVFFVSYPTFLWFLLQVFTAIGLWSLVAPIKSSAQDKSNLIGFHKNSVSFDVFQQCLDHTQDHICVLSTDFQILVMNAACGRWLGVDHIAARGQDFQSESFRALLGPDLFENAITAMTQAQMEGKRVEYNKFFEPSGQVKSGITRFIALTPQTEVSGVLVIAKDTTAETQQVERFTELSDRMNFALFSFHIGVWEYMISTGDLIWSDQMFKVFGCEPEAFDGTYASFESLVHPEDSERVKHLFMNAIKTNSAFELEFRVCSGDQDIRVVHGTGLPVVNKEGDLIKVIGTNRDITAYTESTELVERLSRVANQTENILLLADVKGGIEWVNDAFSRFTGIELAKIKGEFFISDEIISRNKFKPQDLLERVCVQAKTYSDSWELSDRDNELCWFDVRCSPLTDDQGQIQGIILVAVDVTKDRLTQKLLTRKKLMLEEMSYQGRIGAWDASLTTGSLDFSNMTRDIFQMYDDQLLTLPGFLNLCAPDSREVIQNAINECVDNDRQFRVEVNILTLKNRSIWIAVTGTAEYETLFGSTVCSRIFGSIQDVTEQRLNQIELERAKHAAEQAAMIKSQFLANMSHEIRTPMNGVIGMLSLISNESTTKRLDDYASMALTSAESLLAIINDILDFSKIEAGKMELEALSFNLSEFIEKIMASVAFLAHKKNLTCLLDFSRLEHPFLVGDPTRLRQIILNLLGNAIKFTKQGEIGVQLASYAYQDQALLEIKVFDSGIGIAPEKIAGLFDAFSQVDTSTTRHFGGSGLGLSITKSLCDLMGGSIDVHSQIGRGSSFTLRLKLPISKQALPSPSIPLAEVGIGVAVKNITEGRMLARQFSRLGAAVALPVLPNFAELNFAGTKLFLEDIFKDHSDKDQFVFLLDLALMPQDMEEVFKKFPQTCLGKPLHLVVSHMIGVIADLEQHWKNVHFICQPITNAGIVQVISQLRGKCINSDGGIVSCEIQEPSQPRASAKVLVVDDNIINQEVAKGLLKQLSCHVACVFHGEEALAALAAQDYDLVLMDCHMPVMDGFAATAAIRGGSHGVKNPDIPIIALTANAMKSDREECLAAGMNDFLAKPLNRVALEEKINQWRVASIESQTLSEKTFEIWNYEEALDRVGGSVELLDKLMTSFLAQVQRDLNLLKTYQHPESWHLSSTEEIFQRAHGIKGAAQNLSVGKLAVIATNMEAAAKNLDQSQLENILFEMDQVTSVLAKQIDHWRDSLQS